MHNRPHQQLHAAEFFAGIGLVRRALAESDVRVVFANDIDPVKRAMYVANFGGEDFNLCDIAEVAAEDIPAVDIATASFPCTDLSLAGNRAGLAGAASGTFWCFADILDALGSRRPQTILMENVAGLGTSRGGEDLRAAIVRLNGLGYSCDLVQLNALRWLPQSRPRVFVVGAQQAPDPAGDWGPDDLRPAWITRFVERNPDLQLTPALLALPTPSPPALAGLLGRLAADDPRWWEPKRVASFVASLSETQTERLRGLRGSKRVTWRTAYRRTRAGDAVWEIRADEISGCLRTARGGSSRQAVVKAGRGQVRLRWMTAREYAALMGAPDHVIGVVSENQALFGFGDAVCVPAVSWLVRSYLVPLAIGQLAVGERVGRGERRKQGGQQMSERLESAFRALIKEMVAQGRYPTHLAVRNALGSRNALPQLRSGLTQEQTKWRIEEVERLGFDWQASKKAKKLVARQG